ncbi:hypothetical protein D1872_271210 [compost metagenome]
MDHNGILRRACDSRAGDNGLRRLGGQRHDRHARSLCAGGRRDVQAEGGQPVRRQRHEYELRSGFGPILLRQSGDVRERTVGDLQQHRKTGRQGGLDVLAG